MTAMNYENIKLWMENDPEHIEINCHPIVAGLVSDVDELRAQLAAETAKRLEVEAALEEASSFAVCAYCGQKIRKGENGTILLHTQHCEKRVDLYEKMLRQSEATHAETRREFRAYEQRVVGLTEGLTTELAETRQKLEEQYLAWTAERHDHAETRQRLDEYKREVERRDELLAGADADLASARQRLEQVEGALRYVLRKVGMSGETDAIVRAAPQGTAKTIAPIAKPIDGAASPVEDDTAK